jgi:Flp pilus assembly protein TadB
MIAWSTVLFGGIQLVILAVHYYLSLGHQHRIGHLETKVKSIEGKQSNAQQNARRVARKEVQDALDDPAMQQQEQEGGNSSMEQMLPMLMMQMMNGGQQGGQEQQGGQNDFGPVLGSGGTSDQHER